MLKLTALALLAAFLGAEAAAAQTMTLTSPDIAPGATIADRAGRQRLWLHRRQRLARAVVVRSAKGHQELRAFSLRSRRADGQRLLALGRLQHPAGCDEPCQERGQSKRRRSAEGRGAEPHRLRRSRLRRPLPAPRATRRTTIISRSSPWTRRSSTATKTSAPPSSGFSCTSTRSPRRS